MEIKMKSETVIYSDGPTRCVGHMAIPADAALRGGVLVAHEGPGLTDRIRRCAEKIAGLGYVTLAADLYGEGRVAASPGETAPLMASLREHPEVLRARIRAGLDTLMRRPELQDLPVGAVGYCFGGHAVLELARDGAPVSATIAIHGLLGTSKPAGPGVIKGAVLACCGAEDPFVSRAQIEQFQHEMSAAGADWTTALFGGAKHAFSNPDAGAAGRPELAYHAAAAARSWEMMSALLAERLGSDRRP